MWVHPNDDILFSTHVKKSAHALVVEQSTSRRTTPDPDAVSSAMHFLFISLQLDVTEFLYPWTSHPAEARWQRNAAHKNATCVLRMCSNLLRACCWFCDLAAGVRVCISVLCLCYSLATMQQCCSCVTDELPCRHLMLSSSISGEPRSFRGKKVARALRAAANDAPLTLVQQYTTTDDYYQYLPNLLDPSGIRRATHSGHEVSLNGSVLAAPRSTWHSTRCTQQSASIFKGRISHQHDRY